MEKERRYSPPHNVDKIYRIANSIVIETSFVCDLYPKTVPKLARPEHSDENLSFVNCNIRIHLTSEFINV